MENDRGATITQVTTERMNNSKVVEDIMRLIRNNTWDRDNGDDYFDAYIFEEDLTKYFIEKAVDRVV